MFIFKKFILITFSFVILVRQTCVDSDLICSGFARHVDVTDVDLTDYVSTRWYRAPELLLRHSFMNLHALI